MKGRWKWLVLTIGILLISATCGFGYQAKATLSQYELAKQAFEKHDWDTVVDNLTNLRSPNAPRKEALRKFLTAYVEPALSKGDYDLTTRQWNSTMVPMKNEEVAYQFANSPRRTQFIRLVYSDDVLWFDVPIGGKRYGVFQGKQVTLSFYTTFFRVCSAMYPQEDRSDRWKSNLAFIRAEKDRLMEMGIKPIHLYSKEKTWDAYADAYELRIKKWLESQAR